MTIIICYSIAIEWNGTIGFNFITKGAAYMANKNQSRVSIDRRLVLLAFYNLDCKIQRLAIRFDLLKILRFDSGFDSSLRFDSRFDSSLKKPKIRFEIRFDIR